MAHSQCQSDPLDWDGGGGEFFRGRQPPCQDQQVWLTSGSISRVEADSPFTFYFFRLSQDLEMTFSTGVDIRHNRGLGLRLSQGHM